MILCVCPNPALDVTYGVPDLDVGASHRVRIVARRGGGKGLNVARVLHALAEPVHVLGLLGGADGDAVAADLEAAGVPASYASVAGATRRSTAVVAGESTTVFNEPGPRVSPSEWADLLTSCAGLLPRAEVLVLSGSSPPGVPGEAYADLVALARRASVRVLVDVGGAALGASLAAGPDVVKPNVAELGDLLGRPVVQAADALAGARELVRRGAGAAVVSRGAAGLVAVTPEGAFVVRTPPQHGNPTGAGDALAAGLAAGLRGGADWPILLRRAAALAAAAVAEPVAGAVDPARAARLVGAVVVQEVEDADAARTGRQGRSA